MRTKTTIFNISGLLVIKKKTSAANYMNRTMYINHKVHMMKNESLEHGHVFTSNYCMLAVTTSCL